MPTYNFNWVVTNASKQDYIISSIGVLCDTTESGYFKTGRLIVALNSVIMFDRDKADGVDRLNGIEIDAMQMAFPAGAYLDINAEVTTDRPLESFSRDWPAGWIIEPQSDEARGRLAIWYERVSSPGSGSGGSSPGTGSPSTGTGYQPGTGYMGSGRVEPQSPAEVTGYTYDMTPPHECWATVTRWSYPPLFGVKVMTPPPPPPQLFYPTTAGPNYEGSCGGLLLTPAVVTGIQDPEGGRSDLEVAGVKFKLSTGDISSAVAVGILPFKE